MNNKEILLVVDAVSNEKGVPKEIIFQAIEAALEIATQKRYDMELDARVVIDRETGDYETFRQWLVVDDNDEEFESENTQIKLSDALIKQKNIDIGAYIEEPMESVEKARKALAEAMAEVKEVRETVKGNAKEVLAAPA